MTLTLSKGFWTTDAPASDPNWEDVQLLLNFDSTPFTPELSDNAFTFTGDTSSQDTTDTMFNSAGSWTGYSDAAPPVLDQTMYGGGQGILCFPSPGAIWTAECFFRLDSGQTGGQLASSYDSQPGPGFYDVSFHWYIDSAQCHFKIYTGMSYPIPHTTFSGGSITADTWYFNAFVADGSTMSLYVGEASASTASRVATGSQVNMNNKDEFRINASTWSDGSMGGYWPGQIDEMRITDGVARYSGTTCDIPTTPFPTQ